MSRKTLLSWSSGKDSAWALHRLRQDPDYEAAGLFSVVNTASGRVAMHAVRSELLQQQARVIGLPLEVLEIPYPCRNADYEAVMAGFVDRAKSVGIECFAFGDLFLEDVRRYREAKLQHTGIEAVFPLWGAPTDELSRDMVGNGLKAVVTAIDPGQLACGFVGKDYDTAFLDALPQGVDPCGERGEFHSFVFDAPGFSEPLTISLGGVVHRDGSVFVDVMPA
jgi:uncharacterized protein (TIGR00290 family)